MKVLPFLGEGGIPVCVSLIRRVVDGDVVRGRRARVYPDTAKDGDSIGARVRDPIAVFPSLVLNEDTVVADRQRYFEEALPGLSRRDEGRLHAKVRVLHHASPRDKFADVNGARDQADVAVGVPAHRGKTVSLAENHLTVDSLSDVGPNTGGQETDNDSEREDHGSHVREQERAGHAVDRRGMRLA